MRFTVPLLAEVLGVDSQAVYNWENGTSMTPEWAVISIRALERDRADRPHSFRLRDTGASGLATASEKS